MDDSNRYGTLQRQKELFVMMKEIDAFCQKHSISYSLAGGSLLGAIRHNGFIPWDDDIDLMVDRKNLSKFLDAFYEFSDETPYFLNRYLWVYRIQEVNDTSAGLLRPTIDVFVLDHCPDSGLKRKYKTFAIKMLQGMMKVEPDYTDKSLFMKVCIFITHVLGKMFSEEHLFKTYDSVSQIGDDRISKYITAYDYPFGYLNRKYDSDILDSIEYHQFEGASFPIISKYHHYLTEHYGDYMTLPEESGRVSEHMK